MQTAGLVVFVAVVAADTAALLVDAARLAAGLPTFTTFLRSEPAIAVAVCLAQLLIPIGLAFHLFGEAP